MERGVVGIVCNFDIWQQLEAAMLLRTFTNTTPVFVSAVRILDKMFVFFQLKFSPADISHTSLCTMDKNDRWATMPGCEIYKIEPAKSEKRLRCWCKLFELIDLFDLFVII